MVAAASFSSSLLSVSSSYYGRVKTLSSNTFDTSKEMHANDLAFKYGQDLKRRNNLIPLYKCVLSDELTPVLAYRSLVKDNNYDVPSFLFDHLNSAFASPPSGRYSVIGAYPAMEIIAKDNNVTILDHLIERKQSEEFVEDPMLVPLRIMQTWNPMPIQQLPNVFTGGWVGYFGYNKMDRSHPFSSAPMNGCSFPDIQLGLYDDVIVFDHVEKKIYAIHWVPLDQFSSKEEALNDGKDRLDNLLMKIHNMITSPTLSTSGLVEVEAHSSLSHQRHQEILCMESDVAEFALSQTFKRRTFATPFEVYRTIRTTCQSHSTTYLQVRGSIIIASAQQKLSSSSKVLKNLNGYSTRLDALCTKLPSKNVTSTPKAAAIKFIEELEMYKHGSYGGGFGSISFSGDMEICKNTESIVFSSDANYDTMYSYDYNNKSKRREWVAQLQTGASAFANTIDIAESSFVKKDSTS